MHRRRVLRAGRDARRGAGHGVERPALPAGDRLQPGREHDPRRRPVRRGGAALRPRRRVAGRAGRLRRRAATRAHRRRRRPGHRSRRPRVRARLRERSRAGVRVGHRTLAGRVGEHRPGGGQFRLGANTGAGGLADRAAHRGGHAGGLRRRPVQPPHPGLQPGPRRHRRSPGHPVLPAGTRDGRRRRGAHADAAMGDCSATARRARAPTRSTTSRFNYPQGIAVDAAHRPRARRRRRQPSRRRVPAPTAPTCARSAPTASAPGSSASPTT